MEKVIAILLEITIFSVVLLIATLGLQKILCKYISAKLKYAMWALLILRFILPFTINIQIKLVSIVPTLPTDISSNEDMLTPANSPEQRTFTDEKQTKTEDLKQRNSWKVFWAQMPTIIFVIWMIGIIAMGVRLYIRHCQFCKYIKQDAELPDRELLKLFIQQKGALRVKAKIRICTLPSIYTPALLVSPKAAILLPQTEDAEVLRFGILHELIHFKRKDHYMAILLQALTCIYWFNPTIWIAKRYILGDMELACDAQMAETLTKEERKDYAQTLIGLPVDGKNIQLAVGMRGANGRKMLEERVKNIMTNKKTKRFAYICLVLALMLMSVLCFTSACTKAMAKDAEPQVPTQSDAPQESKTQKSVDESAILKQAEEQKPQAMEIALKYMAGKYPNSKVALSYQDAVQIIFEEGVATESALIDCYILLEAGNPYYVGVRWPEMTIEEEGFDQLFFIRNRELPLQGFTGEEMKSGVLHIARLYMAAEFPDNQVVACFADGIQGTLIECHLLLDNGKAFMVGVSWYDMKVDKGHVSPYVSLEFPSKEEFATYMAGGPGAMDNRK